MNACTVSRPPTDPPDDRGWRGWTPGTRVMVRRRLPEGSSHLFTDLLGVVVANDDEGVTLETRAGTVHVPGAEIAVGKPVPPPPTRVSRRGR
jgi:hypothetical protein